MIGTVGAGHRPVAELSDDPAFRRRVVRLTVVSAIALAGLWVLAVTATPAPVAVAALLVAGWILMPTILALSLRRPRLRYGLVVPASLVSLGLLAVCLASPPRDAPAALGWWLILAGVGLGGVLGLWFWYRLGPVPRSLDDPFGPGRWALIGLHVGLVVIGIVLSATAIG